MVLIHGVTRPPSQPRSSYHRNVVRMWGSPRSRWSKRYGVTITRPKFAWGVAFGEGAAGSAPGSHGVPGGAPAKPRRSVSRWAPQSLARTFVQASSDPAPSESEMSVAGPRRRTCTPGSGHHKQSATADPAWTARAFALRTSVVKTGHPSRVTPRTTTVRTSGRPPVATVAACASGAGPCAPKSRRQRSNHGAAGGTGRGAGGNGVSRSPLTRRPTGGRSRTRR